MNQPSRRQFLVLGTAVLALSACAAKDPQSPSHTVKDLLGSAPFYIAHRGSGDNWPEHTAAAYSRSVEAGATAIEVSVQSTRDGVLVCHHDLNTLRMTGVDLAISEANFADLEKLNVDSRAWLGPNSVVLSIPKLQDVLDEHAPHRVVFIEDKQGSNTEAVLAMMESYPNPTEHFVWKQPAPSRRFRVLKEKGYASWGYFAPEDFDKIGQYAGDFEYLGIHHSASEEVVQQLVATGKPVICWEVHTRSMRDKMSSWGVQGMMCSNYPYVTTAAAQINHDQFASGIRTAGDLPAPLAVDRQPAIIAGSASIRMAQKDKTSYLMGSLCPIGSESYSISFDMAWPDKIPVNTDHAGIAFGQETDAGYIVRTAGSVGGYHVVLRGNGSLELLSREATVVSGKTLKSVKTARPQVGKWMGFRIDVTAEQITVARTDGEGWTISAEDRDYRGGYFSLCRNYDDGPAVQFRSVQVSVL